MAYFRSPETINCVQGVELQHTNMAPMMITWIEEEQFLVRGCGGRARESPCKPYRVLHNQSPGRDTSRSSEEEAKDNSPGAVAVMEGCLER